MRRISPIVALLAAAAMLAVGGSAFAAPKPKPPTPAQVQALSNAPGQQVAGSVSRISQAQAVQAASEPGAMVEGAPIPMDEGASLPVSQMSSTDLASAAVAVGTPVCFTNEPGYQWGGAPYAQYVWDWENWCAYYGQTLYYRVHKVHLTSHWLCSYHDPYGFKISGGNGYTWVRSRSGGSFDCPTPVPYITYHYSRWFEVSRNSWGSSAIVAWTS